MQHIDRNKDGFVNFQEFAGALSTGKDNASAGTDTDLSPAIRHYFLQSLERLVDSNSRASSFNANADAKNIRKRPNDPSLCSPASPNGFAMMRQLSSDIVSARTHSGNFSPPESESDATVSRSTGVHAFMHSSDLLTLGSFSMVGTGTLCLGHDGINHYCILSLNYR